VLGICKTGERQRRGKRAGGPGRDGEENAKTQRGNAEEIFTWEALNTAGDHFRKNGWGGGYKTELKGVDKIAKVENDARANERITFRAGWGGKKNPKDERTRMAYHKKEEGNIIMGGTGRCHTRRNIPEEGKKTGFLLWGVWKAGKNKGGGSFTRTS